MFFRTVTVRSFSSILLLTILLLVAQGCEQPFSFSPFDVRIPESMTNLTERHLDRISVLDTGHLDTVRVALVSDAHYHFNDLASAIEKINRDKRVSFVIATGDVTENGLAKEYQLFHEIMSNLKQPYVTVIGNHDYLSNGGAVYQEMYGDFNYTFSFQGVRYIMFDNVLWESNKEPDYTWLETELKNSLKDEAASIMKEQRIVFSHIPPMDGQLATSREYFHKLLKGNGVTLSIHGHKHEYSNEKWAGDNITYVTVGSPQHRGYALLTITADTAYVDQISF